MKTKILILICFLFFINSALSQNSKFEILNATLKNADHDTVKARIYIQLGELFENSDADSSILFYNKAIDITKDKKKEMASLILYVKAEYSLGKVFCLNKNLYDTSIVICQKALNICLQINDKKIEKYRKDFKDGISSCYNIIGLCYLEKGIYKDAILNFRKSLIISREINDKPGIIQCYINMGIVLCYQGEFLKAIDIYNKAIIISQELNDQEDIALCYSNLGYIHNELGHFDQALSFYLKALEIIEKLHLKKGMADCYLNIGNIYYSQKNIEKSFSYYNSALKLYTDIDYKSGIASCYINTGNLLMEDMKYEKAIISFQKALQIGELLGDKSTSAICDMNIGLIYVYQDSYNKALKLYLKSLKIFEELNEKSNIAYLCSKITDLYVQMADSEAKNKSTEYYNEAAKYGMRSIALAREIKSLPEENHAANSLKIAYNKIGDFEKSLQYAEIFIATKDSMFKNEKTKAIAEMETKYQSEKKQLEIDKLGKEKELQVSEMKKQRLIILFVVCGLLFVLGFSVVLFRMFLQKKKANKIIIEKNEALQMAYEEINTQKEEIIVQRDSILEQKEIIEEHQKEIEDSINYARRIQQAVMPDFSEKQSVNINTKQIASPLARNGELLDSFILFKPKDIVSGDFYWATQINNWLIVTVVDCTGHGVPGAFMSMLGISFLNEIIRKKPVGRQGGEVPKASEVLNDLRTSVIDALKQKGESGEQKDGMDIALCVINTETLEMQFAGANNPCWIVSSRQSVVGSQQSAVGNQQSFSGLQTVDCGLTELKGDKMPIGIHSNMQPFTNQIYQLQKGDIIYLMSDGFEDQFGGPNRKKFLAKNLNLLLTAYCHLPLAEQKQILENTISDWIGNEEQIDDITIMGIKIA